LPQDHTQQLDEREVANLLRNKDRRTPISDSGHLPNLPLQANPLPDLYPEEESSKP
jgi:hypothetical protein